MDLICSITIHGPHLFHHYTWTITIYGSQPYLQSKGLTLFWKNRKHTIPVSYDNFLLLANFVIRLKSRRKWFQKIWLWHLKYRLEVFSHLCYSLKQTMDEVCVLQKKETPKKSPKKNKRKKTNITEKTYWLEKKGEMPEYEC